MCWGVANRSAPPFEGHPPHPERSSLRSGFCCPSPSTLTRPHPSHSQAHSHFAALRFIGDASAVLVRLGNPRVVWCFHCAFLSLHAAHWFHAASAAPCSVLFANDAGLHRSLRTVRTSCFPIVPVSMGTILVFTGSLFVTAGRVACLLGGSDWVLAQPSEGFTPGLSTS